MVGEVELESNSSTSIRTTPVDLEDWVAKELDLVLSKRKCSSILSGKAVVIDENLESDVVSMMGPVAKKWKRLARSGSNRLGSCNSVDGCRKRNRVV